MRLGFKRGLCLRDFGFEFEFASLESLVGGPNGRLQPFALLDSLRVFSVSILEQLAGLVEFLRVRLLSRFFPSRQLLLLLLEFLLGLLEGALSLVDRLQGRLRLEGSFRRRAGSLLRPHFTCSDACLVCGQRAFAVHEVLRLAFEFRELALPLGFLAAEFSSLASPLAKFVDFVLEAPDLPLFVLERTSRLREFCAKRLFLILNLAAGSVGFRSGGLQGSHRLRHVLSGCVAIFLEGAGPVRLRLKPGLGPRALGLEFEFAALPRFVRRLKGSPQALDFLGALRNLPGSGLEEFPAVVDLARPGLVPRLRLSRELILGLPKFLLRLLCSPFAVLDRLERLFGLERSLGRRTGSLLGLRLAGLDLRLVSGEGRLPVGEGFGPRVEFRPLGPEVRLFLAEFACLPRRCELGVARLELRAGRVDLPLRLLLLATRRVDFVLKGGERLLAGRQLSVSTVDGFDEALDLLLPLAKGGLLGLEGRLSLLHLFHRGFGVRDGRLVLPQIGKFLAGLPDLALKFLHRLLRLAFGGRTGGFESLDPRLQVLDRLVLSGDLRGLRVRELPGVLEVLPPLSLARLRLFALCGVDLQQDGRIDLVLVGLEGFPSLLAQSHRRSQQLELLEEFLVERELLRFRELLDLVLRQIPEEFVDVLHDDLQVALQAQQFLLLLHQLVPLFRETLHLLLELDH